MMICSKFGGSSPPRLNQTIALRRAGIGRSFSTTAASTRETLPACRSGTARVELGRRIADAGITARLLEPNAAIAPAGR